MVASIAGSHLQLKERLWLAETSCWFIFASYPKKCYSPQLPPKHNLNTNWPPKKAVSGMSQSWLWGAPWMRPRWCHHTGKCSLSSLPRIKCSDRISRAHASHVEGSIPGRVKSSTYKIDTCHSLPSLAFSITRIGQGLVTCVSEFCDWVGKQQPLMDQLWTTGWNRK